MKSEIKQFNPIKVTFETPVYRINEKYGSVYCTLIGNISWPSYVALNKDGDFEFQVLHMHQTITKTARAKCHESDTFDVEKGKVLARRRAEARIYRKVYLETQKYKNILGQYTDRFDEFEHKAAGVIKGTRMYSRKLKGIE